MAALLKTANAPPTLGSLLTQLPEARKALPTDSPQLAGMLALIGLGLLEQKKWTEAEPLLRECLAIREQSQLDVWSTFNTRSLLGGALLGQQKYADAEPLLLAGYEGLKQRERRSRNRARSACPWLSTSSSKFSPRRTSRTKSRSGRPSGRGIRRRPHATRGEITADSRLALESWARLPIQCNRRFTMPIHDWTRVPVGTYHFFHQRWIQDIADALNGGGLPEGYCFVTAKCWS